MATDVVYNIGIDTCCQSTSGVYHVILYCTVQSDSGFKS
jgi:hypothetical protein